MSKIDLIQFQSKFEPIIVLLNKKRGGESMTLKIASLILSLTLLIFLVIQNDNQVFLTIGMFFIVLLDLYKVYKDKKK